MAISNNNKENVPLTNYKNEVTNDKNQNLIETSETSLTNGKKSNLSNTLTVNNVSNEKPENGLDSKESMEMTGKNRILESLATIPTQSFYTKSTVASEPLSTLNRPVRFSNININPPSTPSRRTTQRRSLSGSINRGVHHKIRRPRSTIKSPLSVKSKANATVVTDEINKILASLKNDKLKTKIENERKEKAQIEAVHDVLRNMKDPIAMARPLTFLYEDANGNVPDSKKNVSIQNGFDDDEDDGENDNEKTLTNEADLSFEDMEANMEAVTPKSTKEKSSIFDFQDDDSPPPPTYKKFFKSDRKHCTRKVFNITGNIRATLNGGKISLLPNPVRSIPKRRESKMKVNFNQEQAVVADILKRLDDDDNYTGGTLSKVSSAVLAAELSNTVFVEQIAPPTKAKTIPELFKAQSLGQTTTKLSGGGNRSLDISAYGSSQRQIDAGQQKFGMTRCHECNLVYTAHEPEEEKLHRQHHDSLKKFFFREWSTENVVRLQPEWGQSGRIIRITDSSPVIRLARIMEYLRRIDNELGISSFKPPSTYVFFLAVANAQLIGLVLVQPLEKAHRFMRINDNDCITEEEFDVKIGIMRIWVNENYRRKNIGRTLIRMVQLYTITGMSVGLNEIAFSSPTPNGKEFAKHITGREDFLIYH